MPNLCKHHFSFDQIPDLSGKIAVITGSSSGIGKICAMEMARKNCTVIVAGRDVDKAMTVIEEIKENTGNNNVEFIKLDLMSLRSVESFADQFKERYNQLHILINNAGIMMCPFGLSEDGIETQFATNHVAHFYLTTLLLPELEKASPSRIVNVTSDVHAYALRKINFENLGNPEKYNKFMNYAKSKACNIMFTKELSKRLEAKGINIYVNTNHPGVIRSNISRYIDSSIFRSDFINNYILLSPEEGAVTQLYLATSPEIEEKNYRGKYFIPYGKLGKVWGVASSKNAPKELWDFTERLLTEKIPKYERVSL